MQKGPKNDSHGSVDPLTVITVIAFRDHDPDRPFALSSVVPGHLLCATDIRVVDSSARIFGPGKINIKIDIENFYALNGAISARQRTLPGSEFLRLNRMESH